MARELDLGLPRYMGRGILFGLTSRGDPAVIYFAEGRSDPSRRRKLRPFPDEGRVYMDVNSETTVERMREEGGNPDLLLYNAMQGDQSGLLVVSNGFQTDRDPIWEGDERETRNLKGSSPNGGVYHKIKGGSSLKRALRESLAECGSEPDSCRTARIAYAYDFDDESSDPCIGIVTRPRTGGRFSRGDRLGLQEPSLEWIGSGHFLMVATYGVKNPPYHAALPPSLSSAERWLRDVPLDGLNPEELVDEVWKGLPKEILVGVAAAMRDRAEPQGFRFAKRNMRE